MIDYTEALTAIDVNTGSFHRKGIPHNEAAFLANREAADEIARQIRMRGIGGIILIDLSIWKRRRSAMLSWRRCGGPHRKTG